TVRSVAFKLVALVAMFLLVKQQKDYIIYGGITIFAGVGSNILNFINIRKIISFRYVGHYDLKQHFKPILIFFAMSVAATIYTNLDNIMLGAIKGNIDVGYYNAAVKIKSILVSFVTSLGAVLLPRVSFYFDNGMKKEFRQITKKAIEFVVLLACPVTIYFIIYAKESILFLSGKAFVGAVIPMQLIMPTVLLIGLTNLMGIQMLVPMGFEKIVLYSEIAGATIDLIINFILIPPLASSGASIAALAAETTVFIVQFFALRKMVLPLFRKLEHSKIIMSLILSSALSLPIKMVPTGNFLKLVISALIFFGVYMIILNVLKEPLVIDLEKQVLAKYLNKLRPNVKEN
ncbi:MAG: polysaccharide biosynthesis C-terminal domain-containing protein, partial [[Clostridium] cellulosi]